jgi:hypothetical protein
MPGTGAVPQISTEAGINKSILTGLKDKKVVLYGAGNLGRAKLSALNEQNMIPAYFVDQSHGGEIELNGVKYPVKAPKELLKEDESKLRIIITPDEPYYTEIAGVIREMGLWDCLAATKGKKCGIPYCRPMASDLVFSRIGVGFCCLFGEQNRKPPRISWTDNAQELSSGIVSYRNKCYEIINGNHVDDIAQIFNEKCMMCPLRVQIEPFDINRIEYINMSNYPNYCNSNCIYCGMGIGNPSNDLSHTMSHSKVPLICDTIPYLEHAGLISEDTRFGVACGEIAVNPFKDRIYDAMKGRTVIWLSNCFAYESRIAENLSTIRNSALNLSIDAGTPETWRKVKGISNYNEVVDNLKQYHKAGKITLKYIILPGINDNIDDYTGVSELMLALDVPMLEISKDISKPIDDAHINAHKKLTSVLKAYGLEWIDNGAFIIDRTKYI